jgi:pimeloyl-ACP methyl ester carboxylesterase
VDMTIAKINGIDTAYQVQGGGLPLVLIHGTGVPASTWPKRWIERLAQRRTVITYDYRGTGSTPSTPEPFTTRDLAADVTGILDHLGFTTADVLGHSMGGRVAQWVALDRPELVRKLVLDSTGPGEFGGEFTVTRGVPLQVAVEIAEMGIIEHFKHEMREVGFSSADKQGYEEFTQAFEANPTSAGDYIRLTYARQLHQTTELLESIKQPTLVLVGELETTKGGTGSHVDQARYLASAIPNAEFRLLPGLAHFHFWEAPDETADLIADWLGDE